MKCRCFVLLVVAALPSLAAAVPLVGEKASAFPKGTRAFEVDAAYVHPIRFSDDKFYGTNVAASYYFGDEVSIGLDVQGYFADQPRDDTGVAGLGGLLRWHFLADGHYTLFADAALGGSFAEAAVPEFGTHFNWTVRGGVGATIKLRDDLHLVGGSRFMHLSNGNLHGRDQNPSFDGLQFYAGVMFTF